MNQRAYYFPKAPIFMARAAVRPAARLMLYKILLQL
jgi:hypothetical protein